MKTSVLLKVWNFYRNTHFPKDAVQIFTCEGDHVAWVDGTTPDEVIRLMACAPRLRECLRALARRCSAIPPSQKNIAFQGEVAMAWEAILESEKNS